MDKIIVVGGNELNGEITISGAKNAALPIMAAALLCPHEVKISNIPHLEDTKSMQELLRSHGASVEFNKASDANSRVLTINAASVNNLTASYDIVRKMRASVWVLGPLLARFGEAKVSLPGGCAIGVRPVDMHINALEKLGAEIILEHGYMIAKAPNGLHGTEIHFDKVSVGATANVMMAATLARGKTIIKNAAQEPEMVDLANFLNSMGAKVTNAGTSTITIEGVEKLHGANHRLIGDRVEAGTYAAAVAATGGCLKLLGIIPEHIDIVLDKLSASGVDIERGKDWIKVSRDRSKELSNLNFDTEPFPGFPTDLQAPIMTVTVLNAGKTSIINENIFENRFMHVAELARMGAKIQVEGNTAIVTGVEKLVGAEVMATDLRASVSLIIAALVAEGESVISRVYHLYRGYEDLVVKLQKCGANIKTTTSSSNIEVFKKAANS